MASPRSLLKVQRPPPSRLTRVPLLTWYANSPFSMAKSQGVCKATALEECGLLWDYSGVLSHCCSVLSHLFSLSCHCQASHPGKSILEVKHQSVSSEWYFFFFLQSLLNLLQYCFSFMFFGREACGILALSSSTRDRTSTPFPVRQSLNHWTAREVPSNDISFFLSFFFFNIFTGV